MQFARLAHIDPSPTVTINALAAEKKAQGVRVFNLSVGEPMVETPEVVRSAAEAAVAQNKTRYTPAAGIPELRSAFVAWMNRMYATHFSDNQCVVTCGGKFGLYAVMQALINPGDEVLMIAPYWVSYGDIARLFGGVPVVAETYETDGWKATPSLLEKQASHKTKLLIINNGSNPTGALYSRDELRRIVAWAAEREIVVVSDEVYSGLVYDGREFVSCGSFEEYHESVIVVQSASKHFAMTGWRVGFVLGPEPLMRLVAAIQSQSTSGTSSISQWAAHAALEQADVIVPMLRDTLSKRRDVLVKCIEEKWGTLPSVPSAGLYLFLPLSFFGSMLPSAIFCERLLSEANIALVPGSAFGREGYVRLSFGGLAEDMRPAVEALFTYISRQ